MDILGLGIGMPQLLLVLIVALIVLGPERLPEVARQLAKGVRMLRGYASDVQGQFGGELDEIREELLGIQRDLTDVHGSLRGGLLDLDQSLRSVQGEIQGAASSVNGSGSYTPEPAPEQGPTTAAPPEYTPPTPASLRLASYRASSTSNGAVNGSGEPESRLPDYRPPA